MPIIKSAKKAARQAVKRTAQNQQTKKSIKLALKAFKAKPTAESLAKIQSEYDKAVKKDLLKKNTASRRKAAVAKIAKEAGVKLNTTGVKAKAPVAKKTAPAKKPVAKKTTVSAAKKAPAAKSTATKTSTKKAAPAKKVTTKKTA